MGKAVIKLLCLECGESFKGNSNKKFCSAACKNDFHNKLRKKENYQIGSIVNILKSNRRILSEVVGDKKVENIAGQKLLDKGYVFRYHTHSRINKGDQKEYTFCFDYGYIPLENGWYKVVKEYK